MAQATSKSSETALEHGRVRWHLVSVLRSLGTSSVILAAFLLGAASAQTIPASQVPAQVKAAFQAKFPGAKAAEWKIKTDQNYEAEFTLNKVDIAAKFDATGKWLETESTIPRSAVPQPILSAVATRFKGHKMVETQSFERGDSPGLIYEIHLEDAKQTVKAQFSPDGKVLNQSAKPKSVKGK